MPPLKPDFIPITDEEEARLTAAVESDPDDWFPTDAELAVARPFHEVHPRIAAALRKHGGIIGTETLANLTGPKEEITVPLDAGLATYFKQSGEGWEQLLNDTLRHAVFGEPVTIPRCHMGTIRCNCEHDSEPSNESAPQPKADLVSA